MAVTVIETIESRPVRNSSGAWSGTRAFHVWDDAAPIYTPAGVAAYFGTNGLPIYRDPFPDVAVTMLATNPTIARVQGHTDTWLVVWDYTEGALTPVQPKEPHDVGYIEFSADTTAEFVDTWRAMTASEIGTLAALGGTYAFGTPAASFNTDIGGDPIDVAGRPVSSLVRQASVEFGITMDSVPNLGFFASFVGRRNSVTFNGATKGKVVFLGHSVRRIEQRKYSLGLRFLADEAYHMRQAPRVNPDGSPQLASYVNGGIHCDDVYFVQPYPDFANFYALSPYLSGVV